MPAYRQAAGPKGAATGIAYESSAGRWVLAVAVLGSGLAFLDGTVVNVALPAIGEDLGASTGHCNGSSTATC